MTKPKSTRAPAGFSLAVRVYYEDTDAVGVVYHANYLRFMERARTEWLRSLGHDPKQLQEQEGLAFAVRSAKLKFVSPARYNALLHVSAQLLKLRRASLYVHQEIKDDDSGLLLCSGDVDLAAVDAASLTPRSLPQYLREQLAGKGN